MTGITVSILPWSRADSTASSVAVESQLTVFQDLWMASIWLSEIARRRIESSPTLGRHRWVVAMQLGQAVRDPHGQAYNRTTFLDQRQPMLQEWSDYPNSLKGEG